MSEFASLFIPAIRWDAEDGFRKQRPQVERALEMGCGGYIIFGGEKSAVRDLCAELRERSTGPLLIASDLERGAGQQFAGATGLPPLAALAALGETGVATHAARLTALEALELGVNWVLAPVCDVDLEPANPIVGTRSPGGDPLAVSRHVSEWIEACQGVGAIACAKHFPGHGRTAVDSHAALPVVDASANALRETDLLPFVAAIESGVGSILTAHVSYPALDGSGSAATLSRPILHDLLRTELGYDGIIVTDAMIMEGVLRGSSEAEACVAALAAGCDLVLYPVDLASLSRALGSAITNGVVETEQLRRSMKRREKWAEWAGVNTTGPTEDDRRWSSTTALRCVNTQRGEVLALGHKVDVLVVDDDVGGPYPPPSRMPFVESLRLMGMDARVVDAPSQDGRRSLVVALFGDIRSWKGRAGYSAASISAVSRALEKDPGAVVVQFSHPRLTSELPVSAQRVVTAWGGEKVMQLAAAQWLAARAPDRHGNQN